MSRAFLMAWVIFLPVLALSAARSAEAQPSVTLTIDDADAAEAGQATGAFTVTRTGDTAASLEVWLTIGGSAVVGPDYVAPGLSGRGGSDYSVNIPGGQLSRTITLTPAQDNLAEGAENFTVMLRAPGDVGHDYTIGAPSAGEIVITDDVAQVTLTVGDGDAAEAGQATGAFTVTRTNGGNTAASLEVWLTVGGSAVVGPDYAAPGLSGRGGSDYSVNIPGGQLSRTITLTPVFDEIIEGDETFEVALRGPGDVGHDYTVGMPASGQITIHDFVQLIFKDSFEANLQ